MIVSDYFLNCGSSHHICQDYIARREAGRVSVNSRGKYPIIALSDGCSSVEDTDWGSRFLVNSLLEKSPNVFCKNDATFLGGVRNVNHGSFIPVVLNCSQDLCRLTVKSEDVLHATLEFLTVNEDSFNTVTVGDGVVCAKDMQDRTHVYCYTFENETPFYLRYVIKDEMFKNYLEKHGRYSLEYSILSPTGEVINTNTTINKFDPLQEGKKLKDYCFAHKFKFDQFKSVTIFSDGIKSFVKTLNTGGSLYTEPCDYLNIVHKLTSFKTNDGNFLRRRWNMEKRNFDKQNISHYDDLSIGTMINVPEENPVDK